MLAGVFLRYVTLQVDARYPGVQGVRSAWVSRSRSLISAALVLMLVACGTPSSAAPSSPAASPGTLDASSAGGPAAASPSASAGALAFPQQPPVAGPRIVMEALLFGQLSEVEGCLRVRDSNGVTSYLIVWPPAVKPRITGERIDILNDADAVIMRVGDIIRLSGGTLETVAQLESRQLLSQPIPAHCSGPYWVVGEEMARIFP